MKVLLRTAVTGIIAVTVAFAACSSNSPLLPRRSMAAGTATFRITNTSNDPLRITVRITVPLTPGEGAFQPIGSAPPGISCLSLPDSVIVRGTNGGSAKVDTLWTINDGYLSLVAVPAGGDTVTAWTDYFVAGANSFWSVNFPGHDVAAVAAAGC